MTDPMYTAKTAVAAMLSGNDGMRGLRGLEAMSLTELEAEVELGKQRLHLARQLGFVGGVGLGIAGTFGVARYLR